MSALPKVTRKPRELDSRTFTPDQKPDLVLPGLGEELVRKGESSDSNEPFRMSQLEAMAFQEEPIVILIHRGQDITSSKMTDLIAVNGVPAEMLFKNGWVEVGYLPKGVAITTKRKYVGVISSSKMESLMTRHEQAHEQEDINNRLERSTTSQLPFSVLQDKNPKGAEWLQGVVQRVNL